MQSTWLDDTINAVVSGLNTAVYIRDLTPRVPSSSRRKTGKRRKIKRRKTSSAKGKTGTGVKRRKRKGRRTKSRRSLVSAVTPRSRIANNLRIVKDKKSSSLPTVYRPSEQTLSSMRADIGAASLSIYGDPFDLDPFEEVQQARIISLLEAKRRGISRSALRSHQPVARPVTAGLSRRGMSVHQSGGDVEVAPVPDLLGSILSGQSVLLMDSSDVVINRDGSLKAIQPRSSHRSMNRPFSQSSSRLPSSASHIHPSSHSDLPPRGHPRLQPPHPVRPTHPPGHLRTSGVGDSSPSSSIHVMLDTSSKSKAVALSQSQPKKAPTKPMWVDVSVLPRIPKIKRESCDIAHDGTSQDEMGMNSFAVDKGRQQSLDQQKGSQAPRQRPDGAGSSSTFSNSFSTSSSPTGSSASQTRYSQSSSSSSAVSFRINSSGNSWQSRQLSSSSSSAAGGSMPTPRSKKEDVAKNRQLHRDKRLLLAPRMQVSTEQDSDNIYDPFDPTLSDSRSSDDEAESASLDGNSLTHGGKAPSLSNKKGLVKSKQDLVTVKTETQEIEVSQEEPRRDGFGHSLKSLKSEKADDTPPVQHRLDLLKTERETLEEESGQSIHTSNSAPPDCKNNSSASSSNPTNKKQKPETKSDSTSSPTSRDLGRKTKTFQRTRRAHSTSESSQLRVCYRSRRNKLKKRSKERDCDRRRVSMDKRHGRSRSKSRSRSRSKEHKHKVESQPKDKRRHRSRSSSREKRKEGPSSKSFQKTSGSCVSSSKDTKLLQCKKKEKDISRSSRKEDKAATVNKQKIATSELRKKGKDPVADSQATTAEMVKEIEKKIKKEKQASLDMFENPFSLAKPIKKEETDINSSMVAKSVDEEGNKEDPIKTETFEIKTETFEIKTETFEIPLIKSEPSSPELCHFTPSTSFSRLTTAGTADSLRDTVSESHTELMPSREQQDAFPVKQEAQQPSDSDDDFNVDVMLDNLDYVKSEDSGASGKQEKEIKEETNEQASTAVGAKSKTQVKRVTWNIQEPEGPQPEKSASSKCCCWILFSSHLTENNTIEEVKLAIKPFYQKRDINKDEYKEIVRKAVQKVCHSKSGEINPVKVGNLVKAYVDKYKHARKHKKEDDLGQSQEDDVRTCDSP
uniref:PHD and ring finger domains 1 n=1 Tax=Cyclopterus lumpus TaxID=8103 RepID=A0A8C3B3A9_CYCLU